MGWTYTHKEKGVSLKDFFQKEFSSLEILACASTLTTAYMAARTRDNEVVALVCLIDYRGDSGCNFGYKDMDETQGPCESQCPERILALLTPTTQEYALGWRKRCYGYHEARKRLCRGCTIRFAEPLRFTNGQSCTTFTVQGTHGVPQFYDVVGRRYGISNWYTREYEILEEMNELQQSTPELA